MLGFPEHREVLSLVQRGHCPFWNFCQNGSHSSGWDGTVRGLLGWSQLLPTHSKEWVWEMQTPGAGKGRTEEEECLSSASLENNHLDFIYVHQGYN